MRHFIAAGRLGRKEESVSALTAFVAPLGDYTQYAIFTL